MSVHEPMHLIQLELLKNSMRATVEYHGIDADYPPIKVVIADGSDNEDVIIKVSDEGGGIPRSNMKRIWSYVSFDHSVNWILSLALTDLSTLFALNVALHHRRS